mgnify:FL=1|tara:strand:+ start:54 stop:455 length:402 start_codon:yes stop_codon:yes gene_type:complete
MPIERVNQGFKDISMSFGRNPITNDLIAIKDNGAIARSLRNIVFTRPGEKFFNPNFGSRISESLFENITGSVALAVRDEINRSITNFEPRVDLISVKVTPDYDDNALNVAIVYFVTGIDSPPQQLDFVLQPTR